MGKLQEEIFDIIERHRGKEQLPHRLIAAGVEMLTAGEPLKKDHCIRPDNTRFYVQPYQTSLISREELAERENVLRAAAGQFDAYARYHIAKGPEHLEKAKRNIDMAEQCYAALGEDYEGPRFKNLNTPAVQAPEPVQESDSDAKGGWGSSKPLLSAQRLLSTLYLVLNSDAAASDPLKGIHIHLDDQMSLEALVALGYINRDEVSDNLGITTKAKEHLGIRPDGVPDLPVEVADVTGNIQERELAGRYIDAKIKGVESWIAKNPGDANKHDYDIMSRVLTEIAHEFRAGLHLPHQVIEGRVIPYNDDRDTGLRHADGLRTFFEDVHARNVKAGWWSEITTGEPKKRSVGELFILFVTEIAEAYEAWKGDMADDKLPHMRGISVELADLGIRWADFCGAALAGRVVYDSRVDNPGDAMFQEIVAIANRYEAIRKTPQAAGAPEDGDFIESFDVADAVDQKLAFNASREDHRIENRLKEDGKRT